MSRFSSPSARDKSLHNLIEAIPEDAWTPIPYWIGRVSRMVRLIVRRVKPTPGSHAGPLRQPDSEMLADAEIENAVRRRSEPPLSWRYAGPLGSVPRPSGGGSSPWPDGSSTPPHLHLPQRWPWETQFSRVARLRAIIARLPLTRHPANSTSQPTRANSVARGTPCPPPSPCQPPSSCLCGTPPSSPYIGIGPGPFASPTPLMLRAKVVCHQLEPHLHGISPQTPIADTAVPVATL